MAGDEFYSNGAVMGAIVGSIYILARTVEYLVQRKSKMDHILSDKEHGWLKDLYELHARSDENGIPMVYAPRSWDHIQKELLKAIAEISKHQEKTSYILESIIKRMDR